MNVILYCQIQSPISQATVGIVNLSESELRLAREHEWFTRLGEIGYVSHASGVLSSNKAWEKAFALRDELNLELVSIR